MHRKPIQKKRKTSFPQWLGIACLSLAFLPSPSAADVPRLGQDISPFSCGSVWPSDPRLVPVLDAMQDAGVEMGRFDLAWWALVETTQGTYDWTPLWTTSPWGSVEWDTDSALSEMADRDMESYVILNYTNALYIPGGQQYGPYTEAAREAFGNYAYAAAERYGDQIDFWEIWNEPNIEPFWTPAPGRESTAVRALDYTLLVKEAASRVREADPEAFIIGGVTSEIPLEYLGHCIERGLLDHIDALSVHPYRLQAPESITGEIASLRQMMNAAGGGDIPIWTGEWGYNSEWSTVTELGQAKLLSRMLVHNFWIGIENSTWFSSHPFEGWGIVDENFNRKPSFYAFRALNDLLPAPLETVSLDTIQAQIDAEPSLSHLALLRNPDTGILTLAAWRATWPPSDSYTAPRATLSFDPGFETEIRLFSGLDGSSLSANVQKEGTAVEMPSFPLQDYPTFIQITPVSADGFFLY